ncbi:MAG TPA: hypothetical protein VM432_01130 [Bdellovibrionales bacterium]|nr:hypothetical protein [Bdellovibrionales bacterium]
MSALFLCVVTLIGTIASAQEPPKGEPNHYLGGHYYLPTTAARQPFITSQMTLSFGGIWGTVPSRFINRERELELAGVTPLISYQAQVMSWLALNAGLSGNSIFGTDTASAIDYGASANYNARVGALAKLYQSDTMILSFGFDLFRGETISPSPAAAIRRTINNLLADSDDPLTDRAVQITYRPDFRFAWTFSPLMAMTANLGLSSEANSLNEVKTNSTRLLSDIGLDFNLGRLIGIPIGAKLNYERRDPLNNEGSRTQITTVGVFETYSDRFNFGVEAGSYRKEGFDGNQVSFITRYVY